jgi:hypothetical protein
VALGVWQSLSHDNKRAIGSSLYDLGAQLQQRAQEQERQRAAQGLLRAPALPLPPPKLDLPKPETGPLLKLDFFDLWSQMKADLTPATT